MRGLLIASILLFLSLEIFAQINPLQAPPPKVEVEVPKNLVHLNYIWEQQYYGYLNGSKSLLYSSEMLSSKLAFADIDGDGDSDIFVGQRNGELAFFENRGTNASPDYVLITQKYRAIFEVRQAGQKVHVRNVINVGARSAPNLIDIDDDGDLDLFIGAADGKIWFFENQGNNLVPVFKLITSRYQGLELGKNAVPLFSDVNLKRKYDLLVGTEAGKVWLILNEGTRKKADFTTYKPQKIADLGLETHASPGLIDWDKDGDLDLIVGQNNGTLSLFLNTGDRFFPKWEYKESHFQLIDIGGESAPTFVDMNGDDEKDMVMGSANPVVYYYENRLQNKKRILWNRTTNLFKFHKLVVTGNRGSIAIADLDKDGDDDMIVGEKRGNLNYFVNEGSQKDPNFVLKTEELLFMTGIKNSSPVLADIDSDGDLDLFVGEQEGIISFVENIGTAQSPKWELKNKTYFQIDVGSNSIPKFFDIDKDGDLDLLVGNYAGRITLFENIGTPKEAKFALKSTRFAAAKVSQNAAPGFFDWNQDGHMDLVIGNEEGGLALFQDPGKIKEFTPTWEEIEKAFYTINVQKLSHPLFKDFNGDKQLDLLLGNDKGDFLLFINKGLEDPDKKEEKAIDNTVDQEGSLVVQDLKGPVDLKIESEEEDDDGTLEEEGLEADIEEEPTGPKRIKIDPKYVKVSKPLISNNDYSKTVPTFGDLDNDGDFDLLIGTAKGNVLYFSNEGTDQEAEYVLKNEDTLKTGFLKNTAPFLFDLDQDGDLDIILGDITGQLRYYNNIGTNENPNFQHELDYFKRLWLGKNSRPAAIDLNIDDIPDLLVGNFMGRLVYLENKSNHFSIIRRDYKKIDVKINSSPHFGDLNNSDTKELIIGSDDGKIYFLRNSQTNFNGNWSLIPKYDPGLSFPKSTAPIIFDIDNDGDPDLITGSESGPIYLYRNDAVMKEKNSFTQTPAADN